MKRIKLIIEENWKDPVWSKIIAATIIGISGFVLSLFYSISIFFIKRIPIKKTFSEILIFLNQEILLKKWLFLILLFLYLILVFKPLMSFVESLLLKLKNRLIKDKEKGNKLELAKEYSTVFFSNRMASAFPGIRKLTWFNDPKDAVRRLEILLKKPIIFKTNSTRYEANPIWWFRDMSGLPIQIFKKLNDKKIILNNQELKIKRIAAYQGRSYHKGFVYVEVEGEKQIGINNLSKKDIENQIEIFGYSWEEFGMLKKKFGLEIPIKREDYDDGATVIKGKVVDAMNTKLKIKYLSKYNFIITAKGSPYNSTKFVSESEKYFNGILKEEIKPEDLFDFLEKFNKKNDLII